jgi:hypothetical protein
MVLSNSQKGYPNATFYAHQLLQDSSQSDNSFLCSNWISFNQVVTWSKHEEKINILYPFGEYILSADIKGNVFIWSFRGSEPNSEPVGNISLGDKFTPTCIMHPDTYLNKASGVSFALEIV